MIFRTATHTLTGPIDHEEKTYGAITVREPDVDALEEIEELGIEEGKKPTLRQLRGIISALADAPHEVIGKLHRDDFTALVELTVPLLGGSKSDAPQSSS